MRSLLPDLAIIDYTTAKDFLLTCLKKKPGSDAKSIPVILMAHELKSSSQPARQPRSTKNYPETGKIDQLFPQ